MPRSLLTIPLFVLVSFLSFAQELNYVNYNTHNGLPSSEVHDLYQDKRGYLWIATDRGLARFDGKSFKVYGLEEGLPGTVILRFFPQDDGSIWCNSMGNKVFKLLPELEQIIPYKYSDSLISYFGSSQINSIAVENDLVKFSFEFCLGYASIDKKGNVQYHFGEVTEEQFRDGTWYNMEKYQDQVNIILEWEGSNSFSFGALDESPNLGHTKFIVHPSTHIAHTSHEAYIDEHFVAVAEKNRASIYKDKVLLNSFPLTFVVTRIGKIDNQIWMGYDGGGVQFFNEKGEPTIELLKGKAITHVLKDHEGGFWFSTVASGIYYVPELKVFHHTFPSSAAVHNFDEYKNDLWVNLYNGTSYLVGKDYTKWICQANNAKYSSFESNASGTYFYERDGIERITYISDNSERTVNTSYYRKLSDDDGRMIAVGSNRMYLIDSTITHIKLGGVHVYYDASAIDSNRIWNATTDGLFQFNLITRKNTRHSNPDLKIWISEIDKIENDQFIVGTRGKGIFFLYGDNQVKNLKKKHGLLSNLISEVYVENPETFWVCTHMGLNRIRKVGSQFMIDSFTTEDGLTNNDVTDVVVKNDTVWVGTKSGLDFFPVDLMNRERPKTKVFLELLESRINDVAMKDLLNLDCNQNKIDFAFKAISFRYKDRLKYRYKMRGLETEWNYTNEQKVSYKSLPPGEYELIIQAGVDDFWYNEKIRKKINIAQPYYATWYFITGMVVLVILLIYLFFRFRILSYNRYIIQEILRQVLRRMKRKDNSFVVRVDGQDVKILSDQVLYAKAQGNYVEVATIGKNFVMREKISEFTQLVPDPHEYIQINRSTVIRKDKVTGKSRKTVDINNVELRIGSTYTDVYDQLYL